MYYLTPVQQRILESYRAFLKWATSCNLNQSWPTPNRLEPAWVHEPDRLFRHLMFKVGLRKFRPPVASDEGFVEEIII